MDLWIETCKRVDTIADVAQLTHLRRLTIANCGRIASLTPIRRLTALETVSAWESTDIADGDLSPLLDLPGLRAIRFASRRHYRPTVQDVKAQLDLRRQAAGYSARKEV